MKTETIYIKNGQKLSEVYSEIKSNTILCKSLKGIGATHIEITTPRHSILIEPNVPPIRGKSSNPKYKDYNLFPVIKGVSTDDVIEYLEKTLSEKKNIKILTTPESFLKVKKAFQELGLNMYQICFLLFDECHKIVQDNDYREAITLPIDDFFYFNNKAFVSATPLISSDPRFEEQSFSLINIEPNYLKGKKATDYPNIMHSKNGNDFKDARIITSDMKMTEEHHQKYEVTLVPTNNVLEALKHWVKHLEEVQGKEVQPFCFFLNSTNLILQIINKLGLEDKSSVFCAGRSVQKLEMQGYKNAHEDWSEKYKKPFMFFTSRFYNALDIEMEEKPNVFFISIPFFSDYTLVDPFTDVKQALGRFRNGVSRIVHIVNFNKNFPSKTVEDVNTYIYGLEMAYNTVRTLYKNADNQEIKSALKSALDLLPYNKILKNGNIDYFAKDNFIQEELIKSYYHSPSNLLDRYRESNSFTVWKEPTFLVPISDTDKLSLSSESGSKRDLRKEIVKYLVKIEEMIDDRAPEPFIKELESYDKFIVDAFFALGGIKGGVQKIEECNYMPKRIKEAIILNKKHSYKTVELIKNSFKVGQRYSHNFIKKELKRIYDLQGIEMDNKVTAQTLRDYFEVTDCKITVDGKQQKAFLIGNPLV